MHKKLGKYSVSTVVATLLLILVTVGVSVISYFWVSGYVGSATTSDFRSYPLLKIVAVEGYRGHVVVHVQNIGESKAVIDTLYLETPTGNVVAVGKPVSPNIVNPKEIVAVAFNVGIVPDGKYHIHISSSSGVSASYGQVYLKLTSGTPAIVFSEAKLRGTGENTIELYNPTSAPINLTYYTVVVENPLWDCNRVVRVQLLNVEYSSVYYQSQTVSCPYVNETVTQANIYISPETVIIPPRSYLVFRIDSPEIFDIIKFTVKILDYNNNTIDDAKQWLSGAQDGIDPQIQSLQRVSILPPTWIFADPTFGQPNSSEGVEAST